MKESAFAPFVEKHAEDPVDHSQRLCLSSPVFEEIIKSIFPLLVSVFSSIFIIIEFNQIFDFVLVEHLLKYVLVVGSRKLLVDEVAIGPFEDILRKSSKFLFFPLYLLIISLVLPELNQQY